MADPLWSSLYRTTRTDLDPGRRPDGAAPEAAAYPAGNAGPTTRPGREVVLDACVAELVDRAVINRLHNDADIIEIRA